MKKLFAVLAALFLIAMTSCGSGGGGSSDGTSSTEFTPDQIEKIESAQEEIDNYVKNSNDSSISAILLGAQTKALLQPAVESAEIKDGNLIVKYKDAGQELWLFNTLEINVKDKSAEFLKIYKNDAIDSFESSLSLYKQPTGTKEAAFINALADDNVTCNKSVKDRIKNLCDVLRGSGYHVDEYNGENASPENISKLSKYSVIILFGHGGVRDNVYSVQTGKLWDSKLPKKDWMENKLFPVTVAWEGKWYKPKRFYAIGHKFWEDEYINSHFNNALFMNLACESGSSSASAFREALFSVGVIAYTGWTDNTTRSLETAYRMLISMAGGKTFKEAYECLSSDLKSQTIDGWFGNVISTLWYGPESGYSLTLQSNNSTSLPNLTPYQPAGWSDKIVVWQNGNSTVDDTTFYSDTLLNIRAAYINNGNADIASTQNYSLKFYVDDIFQNNIIECGGTTLSTNAYRDYFLGFGKLPVGTHKIKIVLDADNQITESNENDNQYTKTVTVLQNTTVPTYSISGQITLNGAGLAGVNLTLTGVNSVSTTTDSSGNYSFSSVVAGNYTITPSMNGYTFSPASISVTISITYLVGQNFTAKANSISTYSISGTIYDAYNSGITLPGNIDTGCGNVSGKSLPTILIAGKSYTSSTGAFSIAGIPAGTYVLSISWPGHKTYTNSSYHVSSNQTELSFYLDLASPLGAFAINTSTGAGGLSGNYSTTELAEGAALQACGINCSIISGYGKGTCIAYAKGPYGAGYSGGYLTLSAAEENAISCCSDKTTGCVVQMSYCNPQ